jgi:hypothetical protein
MNYVERNKNCTAERKLPVCVMFVTGEREREREKEALSNAKRGLTIFRRPNWGLLKLKTGFYSM